MTDNYCEDAYDLLQTPIVKKLLVEWNKIYRLSSAIHNLYYLFARLEIERENEWWNPLCHWNSLISSYQLAGILLDTQNLNISTKLSMNRDAEAAQLLSVGAAPNYRNALYDQCMFRLLITMRILLKILKLYSENPGFQYFPIFWFFISVMQDRKDNAFFEVLRHSYGKPSGESKLKLC